MADASVTSPNDLVDLLVRQHEQIKALFDETLSTSGPERDAAFMRLHAEHEEQAEFSKLREELTDDERERLRRTVARDLIRGY